MSNSAAGNIYGLHALCSFDADAAAAAFRNQRGFSSFVRNGAGDYTLTLTDGIAQAQAVIVGAPNGAAASMINIQWLTATTLQVKTMSSAAAAADIDFSLAIHDTGPN